MSHELNRLTILIIFYTFLCGQSKYPADTVLTAPTTSLIKKIGILPIAGWQRLSYNVPALNCQFYPSCSNYGTQAVRDHGLIAGLILTTDRIVRCNPAAYYYHLKTGGRFYEQDGRLFDPLHTHPAKSHVQASGNYQTSRKSPVLAMALSALLPGAGRVYAGRWFDGFIGFITFFLSAQITSQALEEKQPVTAPVFFTISTIIYGGEIYGAFRTAKYYQPFDHERTTK